MPHTAAHIRIYAYIIITFNQKAMHVCLKIRRILMEPLQYVVL